MPQHPVQSGQRPPSTAAPGAEGGSGFSALSLAIIALGAIAAAAFLLNYLVSSPATLPGKLRREPISLPNFVPPPRGERSASAVAPALSRAATDEPTAPALTRAARERDAQMAEVPHPQPAQLIAAQQIAKARREELRREDAARAAVERERQAAIERARLQPIVPSLAPSGRVIQLGVFASQGAGEVAARTYRFRYRGLLSTLPKAVTPYRPVGAQRTVYRVQYVVPNQAYAEIVCQRLRAAGKSCTVIY